MHTANVVVTMRDMHGPLETIAYTTLLDLDRLHGETKMNSKKRKCAVLWFCTEKFSGFHFKQGWPLPQYFTEVVLGLRSPNLRHDEQTAHDLKLPSDWLGKRIVVGYHRGHGHMNRREPTATTHDSLKLLNHGRADKPQRDTMLVIGSATSANYYKIVEWSRVASWAMWHRLKPRETQLNND